MKILIVDDEELARESIIRLLNILGYDSVLEARNGIEAFNLTLTENPDLVLADIRMPEMDGLEYIKKLKEQGYNTFFVFISGYDFFEYTQKAIRLGAFDYILKPVKESDLKAVINNVEKCIELQKKQQETDVIKNSKINQGIELMTRHFFQNSVTHENLPEKYINEQLSELGISFSGDCFCVVLLSIDNMSQQNINIPIKDFELLSSNMENIIKVLLESFGIKPFFFDFNDGCACFLNYKRIDIEPVNETFHSIFTEIKNNLDSFLQKSITIGIGTSSYQYNIHDSYDAALSAVSQRMAKGGNSIFFYEDLCKNTRNKSIISKRMEQEITHYFEKCDYEGISKIINELYTPYKAAEIVDIKNLQKLNLQLILLIYKILEQMCLNPGNLLGDEFLLYNEVNSCNSIDSIIGWFCSKLNVCIEAISININKGNKKLTNKVLEYIHQNISNTITLEAAADQVHLSTNYLSRIFKHELGESFITYVMKYRINKAKSMLKEGNYKANEVSVLVGFNDEKHFYKVFKKITGFTPGEYKKH